MQVQDVMTKDPQCSTPDMTLVQVAKMMKECDCGAIPVVKNAKDKSPIGIITDRDIAIRAVAESKDPTATKVKDCMTPSTVTISPDSTLDACASLMESRQLRRLVVVDQGGQCIGIVVQAQIARSAPKDIAAELVKEISEPTEELVRNR